MPRIRIAGVLRAGVFSPNHIGNDAAIFHAAADELRRRGCEVTVYSEEQFRMADIDEDTILAMCRRPESVSRLQALEEEGRIVINSGAGIENCMREHLTRILTAGGVPYPESITVNTNENVRDRLEEAGFRQCWVKRGDLYALHKEDVSFCRHAEEAQEVLHEYAYRGIRRAVISRHVAGTPVKFYGVAGQPFFDSFASFSPLRGHHPAPASGDTHASGPELDRERLHALCEKAAGLIGIKIYGGDCIVTPDGDPVIVDMNDWPSFAPCRREAAQAIAKCVIAAGRARRKPSAHPGR